MLNGEWFRPPAYASPVLATLRTLPGRPWFPWSTLTPPSKLGAFALGNYLRVLVERSRAESRTRRVLTQRGWSWPGLDNVLDVPLGYFRQPELPIKPLRERATDVYFGGSLL